MVWEASQKGGPPFLGVPGNSLNNISRFGVLPFFLKSIMGIAGLPWKMKPPDPAWSDGKYQKLGS